MNKKHLTILHSNDLHGDFLAEKIDEKLVGGVSLLSGYINKRIMLFMLLPVICLEALLSILNTKAYQQLK